MTFLLRASEVVLRSSCLRRFSDSFPVRATTAVLTAAALFGLTVVAPVAQAARPPKHRTKTRTTVRTKAEVRVSTARLRSGPGEEHKASTLLDHGNNATVVGTRGDWTRLRLESGREGWVRSDLLKVSKTVTKELVKEEAPRRRSVSGRSAAGARAARLALAAAQAARKKVAAAAAAKHSKPVQVAKAVPVKKKTVPPVKVVTSIPAADFHKAVAAAERVVRESEETRQEVETALVEAEVTPITTLEMPPVSPNDVPVEATLVAAGSGPSARVERRVTRALSYRGTPYRMGATGNGAFDCSGFIQAVLRAEGSSIPRTAAEQYTKGTPVAKSNLQPGDLVFFKNTYKHGVSHVGMYIGNGSFVHASSGRGRGVTVSRLSDAYYINHWAGARRPR